MTDFVNEAELVSAFCTWVAALNENRNRRGSKWTVYPETGGFDLLLVDEDGVQVGIEAKLSLNAKVICQALPDARWAEMSGPDYRAVLVPGGKVQGHMHPIATALGLTIITARKEDGWKGPDIRFQPYGLPNEQEAIFSLGDWYSWLPEQRCKLPDYVPDVEGGKPSPVALTDWKIRAIKLLILLDRRGFVTRHDMKLLRISPTRWTDAWHGFLSPDQIKGGYVRSDRTPDLKAQHPTNYAQIEADFDQWAPPGWDALLAAANDRQPKESAA